MNILPRHQRVDDPPDKNRMEWRLWLTLQKYPIQVALFLALLVVAVPVTLLLNDNSSLRSAVRQADSQRDTLKTAVVRTDVALGETKAALAAIQSQRRDAAVKVCASQTALTHAIHVENVYLGQIIVGGAKQSRAFNRIYRRLGLPPYRQRLRQAERIAHGIFKSEPQPPDCKRLVAQALGASG